MKTKPVGYGVGPTLEYKLNLSMMFLAVNRQKGYHLEFVFVSSFCLCQLVHMDARRTDRFVLDPVQVQLNLRLPSMPHILLQI